MKEGYFSSSFIFFLIEKQNRLKLEDDDGKKTLIIEKF